MAQVVERILGKDEVGSSSLPSSSILRQAFACLLILYKGFVMEIIAKIHNDYKSKFGVPRQSGLVQGENSIIVFEPEYRVAEALKGIEEYSHLWILWIFSENENKKWTPTVRPPRLGGNIRKGVFATRSPFRPNSIGLTCVKLVEIKKTTENGTVLVVSGADMIDGTPIIDIKPYLPYVDSIPNASNGFAKSDNSDLFTVDFPDNLKSVFDKQKTDVLIKILEQDPRPQYIEDCERVFGLSFADKNIKFTVDDKIHIIKVVDIT